MIQIEAGQGIGDYQVLGFLGRGAFSQVFEAEDASGMRVALKIGDDSGGGRYLPRFQEVTSERHPERISPDETPAEALFLDPQDGARAEVLDTSEVDHLLLREAELLSIAKGRGVVRLHRIIHKDNRPVLVLDALEGRTLRERIRAMHSVKLRWFVEAMRALEHQIASGNWECHGDLKPENVFITDEEEVVLLDPVPAMTRSDELIATPYYNPFLRRDPKGDAQALAIMLYELATGAMPFESVPWELAGTDPRYYPEEERELSRAYYLSYPRPRDLNPRTPIEVERAIYRALCDGEYELSDLRLDLEEFLLLG